MNYTPRSTNTLWKFNFFNKNICVYVGCMHVCVLCAHTCAHRWPLAFITCMHMSVEVRGRHQVLFSATSPPCILSQGLSVNLEVTDLARPGVRKFQGSSWLHPQPLGLQVWTVSWWRCWVAKLRPACLSSQHALSQGSHAHPPSPQENTFKCWVYCLYNLGWSMWGIDPAVSMS